MLWANLAVTVDTSETSATDTLSFLSIAKPLRWFTTHVSVMRLFAAGFVACFASPSILAFACTISATSTVCAATFLVVVGYWAFSDLANLTRVTTPAFTHESLIVSFAFDSTRTTIAAYRAICYGSTTS